MTSPTDLGSALPDTTINAREVFGVPSNLEVPAFSTVDEHVPELDPAHHFDPDVTLAILSGFARNRRVLVQGLHGTGRPPPYSSDWISTSAAFARPRNRAMPHEWGSASRSV